jgi:hypothetical protein
LSFIARFTRRLLGAQGTVVPVYRRAGEVSPVTLDSYLDAYLKDPAVSAAVDYLAEQAVGVGFFVTSNSERAKRIVEDFNVEVGLDQILMQAAKETVFGGNSFLEKLRENDILQSLKYLPFTSIRRIRREPFTGRPLWYDQRIGGQSIPLEAANIVHFRFNPQNGEAFGSPVIRSLLESYPVDDRYTREPFLKIKARMEAIMPKIFERYAGPKNIWVFPGVPDAKRDEYKTQIENSPQDEDLAFNPPDKDSFDIKTLSIDPRARFEGFVSYIESQYISGMQTPVIKLYTAPGFTEASATVAQKISELKIGFLRRFLKRIVEREIYADLIKSKGMNPVKNPVHLNWGVERPDITLADVVNLAKISADTGVSYLTKTETRNLLRKFGFELEEEPEKPQGTAQNG